VARGDADLAADDPPSKLALSDGGEPLGRDSERPIPACDVAQEAVVVALGARESRRRAGCLLYTLTLPTKRIV
jgi:hypothetical protein